MIYLSAELIFMNFHLPTFSLLKFVPVFFNFILFPNKLIWKSNTEFSFAETAEEDENV